METLERGNGKKDKMHEKKDRYNPGRANFDALRNYFGNSNGSTLGSVRNIHEKYMFMKTEKEGIAGYVSKFFRDWKKEGFNFNFDNRCKRPCAKRKMAGNDVR